MTTPPVSHVFQHGLATVTEARSLDGDGLQDAADVVDDQGGQGLALDVFGHDQQRTAGLGNLLQHRQQITDVADLLVAQQDERAFQHGNLAIRVVDEVGRQVATVELHALDHVQLVAQRLAVLDGDDAFLANLLHGVGDDLADLFIAVGRDGADLSDFLAGGGGLGLFFQLLDQGGDGLVDATLQVHRVHAGGHVLHALTDDGLGQHGGGGGAVTGVVAGARSHFLDQLGAHVGLLVLQLDFLGHRDTVLGDGGGAEGTLQHHVAALGAEGDLDGVGQDVDAFDQLGTGFVAEIDLFCCHVWKLLSSLNSVGRGSVLLDHGHDVFFAHHQQLLAVDLDGLAGVLAEEHLVTDLDGQRTGLAVITDLAVADGQHFTLVGLLGGIFRQHDAGSGLALVVEALDDDAVVQGAQFHSVNS